jgi:hypothetical protein
MDRRGHARGCEVVSLVVVRQERCAQSVAVWAGITLVRISFLEDPAMDDGNAAMIAIATRGSTRNFALGINMILTRLNGFSALFRAKSLPLPRFPNVSGPFRGTGKWFQGARKLA